MATTTRRYYTEAEITEAVRDYADHHDCETTEVEVSRAYEGDTAKVIGFRLALRHATGCDERFGDF